MSFSWQGVPSVQAAENATKTIPIIFTGVSADPVGAKFIASLARPGGNLTGMSVVATELAGKRLELLKETIPNASRLAALYDPATDPVQLQEMRKVVQRLWVQLEILEIRDRDGFESAFEAAKMARIEGISVLPAAFFYPQRNADC
jgi:putative ABC transport system substrate-binding protein